MYAVLCSQCHELKHVDRADTAADAEGEEEHVEELNANEGECMRYAVAPIAVACNRQFTMLV